MDQMSDRTWQDAVLCLNRNEDVVAVAGCGVAREWKEDWGLWQMGRLFKEVDNEHLSRQDGGGQGSAHSLLQFTWTEGCVSFTCVRRAALPVAGNTNSSSA